MSSQYHYQSCACACSVDIAVADAVITSTTTTTTTTTTNGAPTTPTTTTSTTELSSDKSTSTSTSSPSLPSLYRTCYSSAALLSTRSCDDRTKDRKERILTGSSTIIVVSQFSFSVINQTCMKKS